MAELGEREMDWGERLSRLLAVSGEKPLLEALECGMETLAGIASGEVEVTPGMERLVEGLEVIYLGAVAWPEERAYDGVPGDGDAAGSGSGDDRPPLVVAPMEDLGLDEVLETGPMGAALALSPGAWVGDESRSGLTSGRSSLVPAAVEATRRWSWQEHMDERRRSLRAMRELAQMVQYRLGTGYQAQVAMLGLVAKIELALIYMLPAVSIPSAHRSFPLTMGFGEGRPSKTVAAEALPSGKCLPI